MSSTSSVLPSDLVSVEVAAQQVGAHPQTSLTRCTFPVLYPVPAPEREFGVASYFPEIRSDTELPPERTECGQAS